MAYKKISVFVMAMILSSPSLIPSNDNSSQNTTALINFVDQQERDFKYIKSEASRLWDTCIYSTSRTVGNTTYYESGIKYGTSYADISKLYAYRQKIRNFQENTKNEINELLTQGASFNAVDNQGKTALNHAQSYDVYHALRSKGASFQFDSFLSIYRWYAACTSTLIIAIAYKLYANGYMHDETKNTVIQTRLNHSLQEEHDANSMHYRDEQDRTPLMNYLIKQEELLTQVRSDIEDTLKQIECGTDTVIHEYYSYMIEYQDLCNQTRAQIAAMIEQGADVNVQDANNKYLLDYCQSKEIYKDLQSAGALSKKRFWDSFDYES